MRLELTTSAQGANGGALSIHVAARRAWRYTHGHVHTVAVFVSSRLYLPWQAIFVWIISCQVCLERLQSHHDVGNKGTSDDFMHGVAGSRDKKKLANLRGAGRRA